MKNPREIQVRHRYVGADDSAIEEAYYIALTAWRARQSKPEAIPEHTKPIPMKEIPALAAK